MRPYADRSLLNTIREQQENAVEDDYRVGLIRAYLDETDENGMYLHDEVSIIEIWTCVLRKDSPFQKPTRKDSDDVALILTGFDDYERAEKPKRFYNFGLQRYWRRIKQHVQMDGIPF